MTIKERIKRIPFLGKLALNLYTRYVLRPRFRSSASYWESRYRRGGNSGVGSYQHLAEFKADVINSFVEENKIQTVIEFGCGDGNQLQYFHFTSYTGFDVSETAIARCRNLYKEDLSKRFALLSSYAGETADLTLSLDVIYHLVEDEVYQAYMDLLFASSSQYVIIYSSNAEGNAFGSTSPHVRHRRFTDWVKKNAVPFRLIQQIPNQFSYGSGNRESSFADFYFYKRTN